MLNEHSGIIKNNLFSCWLWIFYNMKVNSDDDYLFKVEDDIFIKALTLLTWEFFTWIEPVTNFLIDKLKTSFFNYIFGANIYK